MNNLLVAFCQWLQNTDLGLWVGRTLWGYPFVQMLHFFGLSLWIGTIVLLDLRLIGVAGTRRLIGDVSEQLFPWTWAGLAIALTGGTLLFSASAETYFNNPAFRIKVPLVLTGIAYHVVILLNVRKWSGANGSPTVAKLAGLSEMALWLGVITAAVMIPNY